jgi:hypothetical protein
MVVLLLLVCLASAAIAQPTMVGKTHAQWLKVASHYNFGPFRAEVKAAMQQPEFWFQMKRISYTNRDTVRRKIAAGDPNRTFWCGSTDPDVDAFVQALTNYKADLGVFPHPK